MTHLATLDLSILWIDRKLNGTKAVVCEQEHLILVQRNITMMEFTEHVARALARLETPDDASAALLAAQRLLPLNRLCLALAINDSGPNATALALGVATTTLRLRLDALSALERATIHREVSRIQRECGASACPGYKPAEPSAHPPVVSPSKLTHRDPGTRPRPGVFCVSDRSPIPRGWAPRTPR